MLLEPESRATLVGGQDGQLSDEHTSLSLSFFSSEAPSCARRALAFDFSWVPPSYSASSLVKRAGLVWCSKDLPYLNVAEILPVLTL